MYAVEQIVLYRGRLGKVVATTPEFMIQTEDGVQHKVHDVAKLQITLADLNIYQCHRQGMGTCTIYGRNHTDALKLYLWWENPYNDVSFEHYPMYLVKGNEPNVVIVEGPLKTRAYITEGHIES